MHILKLQYSTFVVKGYEPLEHVLTPRLTAFKTSLQQLTSHVTAVYDITIGYSNTIDVNTGERTPAYSMPG